MTAEEIEAIVGGYHGDAFRILGPHAVRKKKAGRRAGRCARFCRRRSPPRSSSASKRCPMAKQHAAGLLLRRARRRPRRLPHPRAPVGRQRPSRSTTPIASARRSPIPTFTCTPKARSTRATHAWARTSSTVEGVAGVRFAVWAPNAENVTRGRRFQRVGHPPPSHAARNGGVWEIFIPGPRRRHGVQILRPLALRRLPAAEGRPLRLLLRDAAEIGVGRVGHLRRYQWHDAAWMEARAKTDWLKSPIVDLRSPPGILAARPAGTAADLSRAGRQAGAST